MDNANFFDINSVDRYKEVESKLKKKIVVGCVVGGIVSLLIILYPIPFIIDPKEFGLEYIPPIILLTWAEAILIKITKNKFKGLKDLKEQYVIGVCNDGEEVLVINPPQGNARVKK